MPNLTDSVHTTAPFAPCVCGHQPESHDGDGCQICTALGQRCDGYWTLQEFRDAVNSGLSVIAIAEAELRRSK